MKLIFILLFFCLYGIQNVCSQSLPSFDEVIENTFPENEIGENHGKGKIVWLSGDSYEGNMVDGFFSGYGKMHWLSGEIYEGEWVKDTRQGLGKMTWPNGTIYIGLWENNVMHGKGEVAYSDGTNFKGEWKNGELIKKL